LEKQLFLGNEAQINMKMSCIYRIYW